MAFSRQEIYRIRRQNIKAILGHGDIKRLAEILLEKYPEVSVSTSAYYANYLTQVFNLKSKRPFKEELARQIEQVWDGLSPGQLDSPAGRLQTGSTSPEQFDLSDKSSLPAVLINGVEYVPKAEVPELTDQRLLGCLRVLTEMRYFNQYHKMMGLAYNAIHALSPELAELGPDEAYHRIHGTGEE